MTTINQMLQRVKGFDRTKEAGEAMSNKETDIVGIVKDQLMHGLGKDGEELAPRYSQDPYFKSKESANRYAQWKKSLYPEMTFDVPNLIITGMFHKSIKLRVDNPNYEFTSSAPMANSIMSKYNGNALGLNKEGKQKTWAIIAPDFVRRLKERTGMK